MKDPIVRTFIFAGVAAMAAGGVALAWLPGAFREPDTKVAQAAAAKAHAEFNQRLKAPPPPAVPAQQEPVELAVTDPGPAPENVTREISFREMAECQINLQNSLKDPDSYKELSNTRESGGVIHYTATNSFGGRVRSSHHCLTGLSMAN